MGTAESMAIVLAATMFGAGLGMSCFWWGYTFGCRQYREYVKQEIKKEQSKGSKHEDPTRLLDVDDGFLSSSAQT